ncbi:hypothetical protein DFH08DRAFT_870176 [Mycena albidolilacea]|uniref:Uncharacterized protein n=1 Tax=Mycena albidolilacea TaxID=1033008 RepID=A0AAD7A0E2_9AGAR|nr:hypothetical protein DFH08DRAFT_870176 [Mycena albidolilacea]
MYSPDRPPAPQSTHSWWSDRNSVGPTISIHAMAKPLIRLMYHSQVRTFIKKNRGIALSEATMQICVSYLAYKYISPATKALILDELNTRVKADEDSARVVGQAFVQQQSCLVAILLDSPDAEVRCRTCKILGALRLKVCLDNWEPCAPILVVVLLGEEDDDVRTGAMQILSRISSSLDGARAVGSTDFVKYAPTLLKFATTRPLTYETLDNLTLLLDEPLESFLSNGTIPIHAMSKPLRRLMHHIQVRASIKRNRGIALSDMTVQTYFAYMVFEDISHATRVLLLEELDARIKADKDSARVVGRVLVQHRYRLALLLDSSDARIWCYTWKMLAALDFYWDDWEPPNLARIVELLGDEDDDDIRTGAIQILCRVSRSLSGARAVGSTNFLKYVPSLLDFATTRLLACETLNHLAFHRILLLDAALQTRLELLVSDDDAVVREQALSALLG